MSLLTVENLRAGYGKKEIISQISLQIEKGQVVGILGPNGCGKSTLIKALCQGIPYGGNAQIEGTEIAAMSSKELAQKCSYVPQRSGLAIDITVMDAVLMGYQPYLGLLQRPSQEMEDRAAEILDKLGIKELPSANYMELSEGQKRLCILARSLVTDPQLLIMDEPDGALDFQMRIHLMEHITKRVQQGELSALISLHDVNLALTYCDQIYLMKQGQICGQIRPKTDDIHTMEQKLSDLYGSVKLMTHTRETGERELVMVQS